MQNVHAVVMRYVFQIDEMKWKHDKVVSHLYINRLSALLVWGCSEEPQPTTPSSPTLPHIFPSFTLIRPTLLDLPNSELLERVIEANNISMTGAET